MGEANKTLPPTHKKLKDAEKEGNFNYSSDVTQMAVLLAGLLAVLAICYQIPTQFDNLMQASFTLMLSPDFASSVQTWLVVFAKVIVSLGAIIFLSCGIIAWVATICQVGFVFSGAKIQKGISFEQGLNVVSNAKNLFSKQSLATVLMGVVKVVVICYVSYYVIKNDKMLTDDIYSCRLDLLCGLSVAAQKSWLVLIYIAVAMVPLAALDWFIHHKIYIGQNMMSPDEVEREHKDAEGDPHMKSHRKQFAQELLEDNFDRVNKASAIIRNPTHVAIAVRYEPGTMALPYVVAMGEDDKALAILRQAQKEGIPSYIDIPLARRMLTDCTVNTFVPLRHMDDMITFMGWLTEHHPERVYDTPEFANVGGVGGVGDVKR